VKTLKAIAMVMICSLAAMAAEAPKLQNAKVVAGNGANLAAEVQSAERDSNPSWVAWAVPMIAGEQQMCCFDSMNGMSTRCGCTLGNRNQSQFTGTTSDSQTRHLESPAFFYVFLRTEGGKVEEVRTFSADCPIDGDGMTVRWLGDARPADSVALLSSLVGQSAGEDRHDKVADSAVMAIAFTNDPSADAAIDKFLAASQPNWIRKKAAFWTAQLRDKAGLDKLIALMRNDGDDNFRSELTFDLSQSKLPQAQEELIRAAHQDSSSHVRGQALFWLAQKAGKKVAGAITDAIERDPDTEVKKKAVFALSQMPKEEGIPLLINVAKTNSNPAVRKQAIFWLGQSNDPKALDFIESVLKK
jgi:HEAT repeat protein